MELEFGVVNGGKKKGKRRNKGGNQHYDPYHGRMDQEGIDKKNED